MELLNTPELEAFRQEVRAFLAANLTDEIRRNVRENMYPDREMHSNWHALLLKKGWAAPGWPKKYGGCEWPLEKHYIFEREFALADAPRPIIFNFDMVGPMFIEFGTEEQRKRFLPRALTGEDRWCQGFSEPGAGSDLASLQCRAKREGDHYVLNGTKIWTSLGLECDMMFGLFRTDGSGKKQEGITVLVMSTTLPGFTRQPIRLIDGSVEVCQCFFDDVKVPVENLVGEEGKGWGIAKHLLGLERLGTAEVARTRAMIARLKQAAREETGGGAPLIEDPFFAGKIAELETELDALDITEFRFLFDPEKKGILGPEASILKLCGTVAQMRAAELIMEAAGHYAIPLDDPGHRGNFGPIGPEFAAAAAGMYFNLRKIAIYGGSNEIQRNIVSKAVLGL
ncbi:MAG: acyl-CoA dehydrogenase family protein [Dongiaceae bacterium]